MNARQQMSAYLSKINFALGNKPKLISYPARKRDIFLPQGYRAVFMLSCDFELSWAWRFSKKIDCNLQKAKEIALEERKNLSFILQLCEQFNIPIIWATVGHLFLESCQRKNGTAHPDVLRLKHFENTYWNFSSGEWFDHDPCCNLQKAPEWYAGDLVGKILASSAKHEIACHTFSHIDCREKVCPPDVMRSEIAKCKELASAHGIELQSFVFPGNFVGNLKVVKEEGFMAYRRDSDVLGFPQKDPFGLWQIPTTAEIAVSRHNWNQNYYIEKYRTIIERAIKHGRLCHFWFHPSADREFLTKTLTALFEFINIKRQELYLTTMNDYVSFLGNEKF